MKKVFNFLIILFLVLLIIGCNKKDNSERYDEIKKEVEKESLAYLNLSYPIKYNDNGEQWLYEDDLIDKKRRGADKSILLDVDEENYCDTVVHGKVIDNEWKVEVFINCKDFKDSEYDDQLEWLMCNRVVSSKYYEIDFEHYKCPDSEKVKR